MCVMLWLSIYKKGPKYRVYKMLNRLNSHVNDSFGAGLEQISLSSSQ